MFRAKAQRVSTSPLNYFYLVFSIANQRIIEYDAFQNFYNNENINNISKIM